MSVCFSIITPAFNCSKYIDDCIKSVISQTFRNWEMIIVDDCSTDNSAEIIRRYCSVDHRIQYLQTDKPSGSPVLPRNIGINAAQGRYIAFLDSDDQWLPEKLENQLRFFDDKNVAIVFSNYEKVSETGERNGRKIIAPEIVDYKTLLKGNCIGCLTATYDTLKVGKMYFQDIGHEDYALWLAILKKGYIAKNSRTIEALYRLVDGSLSANKFEAFKWHWHILKRVERLSYIKASYYFINYAFRAVIKQLK